GGGGHLGQGIHTHTLAPLVQGEEDGMEAALLLYGDTERNAALRHELPIVVIDPFLFGLVDGRPHVMVTALERERIAEALPEAELHDVRDLGFYELIGGELSRDAVTLELASRAAAAM